MHGRVQLAANGDRVACARSSTMHETKGKSLTRKQDCAPFRRGLRVHGPDRRRRRPRPMLRGRGCRTRNAHPARLPCAVSSAQLDPECCAPPSASDGLCALQNLV